ncbi:ATP-dependent helicase HepA [Pseudomonas duriflava]|uniref:ATP-dependent helicase HepA n=1 Tax=Pseudomonas duriflava TaxID=459528 RepID=A0A562PYV5_9PSED|nr:protein DpdE [Pseudomonas duriflava]TWI49625.1 ATP-dependent helicase HepA [Pseudomonas duriflava]
MDQGLAVGELVQSSVFSGIGKLSKLDLEKGLGEVAFFESPLNPETRKVRVNLDDVRKTQLYEEAIVYCQDRATGIWRRGRYGGPRPLDRHLVIFRADNNDQEIVEIDEIYCLNLGTNGLLDPSAFLAARSNDAPYFFPLRQGFLEAYIEQRAACCSIGAITSSSVELEPHQIAVVRRVLKDSYPKYLLADEVGLGKTIEAGLIIREHVLQKKFDANVLIAAPASLVTQWHEELKGRFHLGELMSTKHRSEQLIRVCSHEQLVTALGEGGQPSLFVVDEMHQLAPLAWSSEQLSNYRFQVLAKACQAAEATLLLSGTPLNGNERNFLAMLHCLSPEAYEISEAGVQRFIARVKEREWLGGLYSALTPDNSNGALEQALQDLRGKFPEDQELHERIGSLMPLVDLFAEESGEQREQQITGLRHYLGEHYRLHQRMLRNRREMGHLAQLFPGLAGLRRQYWPIQPHSMPLDLLLEEYRSQACRDPDEFQAMSSGEYLDWVDDLLGSPLLVKQRADKFDRQLAATLEATERELLAEISKQASLEQACKDRSLSASLEDWLAENPKGKVVVFCGDEVVADHVAATLGDSLAVGIERNASGRDLQFLLSGGSVRVLVCDQGGEDGLNLHGGQKLAVHYSLPRSFSRVEQRLGRLNRYSANLRGIRPVESLVLMSDHDGLFRRWLDLLDTSVGVFNQTVASLQYVLEEHLEKTWQAVARSGDEELLVCAKQLSGEGGLLDRERRRVKVQEELLALDEDVAKARDFAERISEADEIAEEQIGRMCAWMTRGLNFRLEGDLQQQFRLGFGLDPAERGGRTLVDVKTFIEGCITGIDPESGNPPYTAPMSFLRQQASVQSGVYPFRYGQPFVDSIYELAAGDSRGATCAFLRILNSSSLQAPKIFFHFKWLVTAARPDCTYQEQVIADELLAPAVYGHWIAEDGSLVKAESILKSLEWPYKKPAGAIFQDINLRHDVWSELEFLLPVGEWKRMVLGITKLSRKSIIEEIGALRGSALDPHVHLMAVRAQILCSKDLWRNE